MLAIFFTSNSEKICDGVIIVNGLEIRITDQTAESAGDQLNLLVSLSFRIGLVERFGDRASKDFLV